MLWGAKAIEWVDLPNISRFEFNAELIAKSELNQDQFAKIFSKFSVTQIPSQLIFIESPDYKKKNFNVDDFRKNAAIDVGIDINGTTSSDDIYNISREIQKTFLSSPASEILTKLKNGSFIAALENASEAERKLIFALASCMSFHRIQKATKFLESFSRLRKVTIKNWLIHNANIDQYDYLANTRVNELFRELNEFAESADRTARKAARSPANGKSMLAYNGRFHPSIENLKNGSEQIVDQIVDDKVNNKRDRALVGQVSASLAKIIQDITQLRSLYSDIHRLRNDSVGLTNMEAGIGAIRSDSVRFFRSYSAGLTERALLMGLIAEAHWVAKMLTNEALPSREKILGMMGRDQFGSGLSTERNLAKSLGGTPDVNACPRLIDLCELQVAALDVDESKLPSISNGGQADDKKLAQLFLSYIYEYDRWDQPVEPSDSEREYREHRWRRLYARFGVFGHLFV